MWSARAEEATPRGDVWVISRGSFTEMDLSRQLEGTRSARVKEYQISDLARYLLSPERVVVRKKLIGCEVSFLQPPSSTLRDGLRRWLPARLKGLLKDRSRPPEVLMSHFELKIPHLRDPHLEMHLNRLYASLRPYDSIMRRLSKLDASQIADIIGLCEDIGTHRSKLTISGSVEDKLHYMDEFILKDVEVILERAHVAEGLFELSGFDFRSFQPERAHRMITFLHNGKYRACVLNPDDSVAYRLDDIRLIQYMHLLEQSISTSQTFHESLRQCIQGRARPTRLLITRKLEIKYSRERLPSTYLDVFSTIPLGQSEKEAVVNSLNHSQLSVSLNYLPQAGPGEERLMTSISVLHDLKALEPLKNNLPELYSELSRRAALSEAGRFYLLDSIRGYNHEG